MNTLLSQKNYALDAAVWPLGRPEKAYEIPMWQDICREWVADKMQPTNVTHLVEELLRTSDKDDLETTANDIRKAVLSASDWDVAVGTLGWCKCDDLIEQLTSNRSLPNLDLLAKVVCLAAYGFSDTRVFPDDPEYELYWVRSSPAWVDGGVVETTEVMDWADMTDTYVAHRAAGAAAAVRATGNPCSYRLERCSGRESIKNPEHDLSEGKTLPLARMLGLCNQAVTAWVISEWLEPHGFVNFDQADWSSLTSWQALGEELGAAVDSPEVSQWLVVSESAAESLREVGAVVSELTGSSNGLLGRTECGQALHTDSSVQRAMIHSGYLDRTPPLGALHRDTSKLPRIKFTLGGDEFPFRVYGYSEHRPNRELDGVILDPFYRENGWCVIWGPSCESLTEGLVRMFKLSPVTPEGHPEPAYHEC